MDKIEYRAIIKFLTKEGVKSSEIHQRLVNVYGASAPSCRTVEHWAIEFKHGRESVEDDPRSGRPATAQNEEMIEKIEAMVMEDRRISARRIVETLDISHGSVLSILHDQLHMNKVSARWVPRMLTPMQKHARLAICRELSDRAAENQEDFFNRIITMDESWVHHYDPETKEASKQWKHTDSPPPKKFKVRPSAGKVMLSVFWDAKGILLIDFLEHGHTITGDYYANLLTKLHGEIKAKRRGILRRGVLLLHDNAPAHTSAVATKRAGVLKYEILPHPPYSPDLAPSDFYLFGKLKDHLRGRHFHDDDTLKNVVTAWLESQETVFYNEGIQKLKYRWEKCINLQGDYVEK